MEQGHFKECGVSLLEDPPWLSQWMLPVLRLISTVCLVQAFMDSSIYNTNEHVELLLLLLMTYGTRGFSHCGLFVVSGFQLLHKENR